MKEVVGRTCFPIGLACMHLNPQGSNEPLIIRQSTTPSPDGHVGFAGHNALVAFLLLPPEGVHTRMNLPPASSRPFPACGRSSQPFHVACQALHGLCLHSLLEMLESEMTA